ncbi:prephenate dehydratase domain-containing protein [Clostridium sp. DJ247]|uniref:prephenate dehydratase n=1 Tax=Clostridium sp. DJ247 TaxID=2726188 RepID=UPI001625737B|nr:prephenate dehydratase domain-containing protein [Clostridium sp. DJ247]MBC2582740.1 ACT domain-containing protein [Clostridium sp. DJ247]
MNKLAVLGPSGTFSELAAKKYMDLTDKSLEITFYPSIGKAFNAVGTKCDFGIIPIENSLDGYVQPTLDLLSTSDVHIIYELCISIQFSFVANVSNISDVKKIYAQFKTQGQCSCFLDKFINTKIITTESNGESLDEVKRRTLGEGAIVPKHSLGIGEKFSYSIKDVTDSPDNQTRFIVISKHKINYSPSDQFKTSIVIMNAMDKPGVLSKILNEFSERNINLTSITSRPTKKGLGKYYFFIDMDGNYAKDENLKNAIDKISKEHVVKVLGYYPLI